MDDIIKVSESILDHGFSIIPTNADKKPTIKWKQYQDKAMTKAEAQRAFAGSNRIALIGGKVSGNLEALDFDVVEGNTVYDPFIQMLTENEPSLATVLVKRKTPSGGYHLIYRCSSSVAGNLKLAMQPGIDEKGKPKEDVLIETRGEGGYFLTTPSPGYNILEHSLLNIPTITPGQVELLHSLARMFDQRPQKTEQPTTGNNNSPGTDYNNRQSIKELLTSNGWKEASRTTEGMGWTRPEKEGGTSGVLLDRTGNFYCWSSNAYPLEVGKSYSPFAFYTAYDQGGNFSAAAKALLLKGYGTPKVAKTKTAKEKPAAWEPEIRAWPTIDTKAYHGITADFVDLASRNSEADPVAILATFLVRFGVECGPDVYMQVGDSKHRARLASVIVGASSKARKGTSGKPVNKLFELSDTDNLNPYSPARTSKGPFSSGEGIIYAIRDSTKKWNKKEQVEEIADPGIEDKRLFVLDEEFGGVLANTKREGNTLSMIIRQAWDSGDFDPLTKNNKTTATGGHVGWVSHITLQELRSKLNESEGFNGFCNRILWVCAKRQKLVALPKPMPHNELVVIKSHLRNILDSINSGAEVKLGQQAEEAWRDKYYAELTKDRPGLSGCVTNRGEAQALRLAMVYSLLDGSNIITLEQLEAGIAFWDYCRQSANYIFQGRQTDNTAQKILTEVKKGPLTGTDIYKLFGNNISKNKAEVALSELMASGQIKYQEHKNTYGKGRPTKTYIFNESLHELNEINELNIPAIKSDPINLVNSFNSLENSPEWETL